MGKRGIYDLQHKSDHNEVCHVIGNIITSIRDAEESDDETECDKDELCHVLCGHPAQQQLYREVVHKLNSWRNKSCYIVSFGMSLLRKMRLLAENDEIEDEIDADIRGENLGLKTVVACLLQLTKWYQNAETMNIIGKCSGFLDDEDLATLRDIYRDCTGASCSSKPHSMCTMTSKRLWYALMCTRNVYDVYKTIQMNVTGILPAVYVGGRGIYENYLFPNPYRFVSYVPKLHWVDLYEEEPNHGMDYTLENINLMRNQISELSLRYRR